MKHYTAYHNVDSMGYDLQCDNKELFFISRKPEKFLKQLIGNIVWMFSGKKGSGKRKTFYLCGYYFPEKIIDDDEDVKNKLISGTKVVCFKKPMKVTEAEWFLKLKKQQANFSIGIAEIKDNEIIEVLSEIYSNNPVNTPYKTPEEIDSENLSEGRKTTVQVNKYERSAKGREKCIEYHGLDCAVCGFNFEKIYGEIGCGFIHVHHISQLSTTGEYILDPEKDLIPICANCHAMIHKRKEAFTVSELKKKLHIQH